MAVKYKELKDRKLRNQREFIVHTLSFDECFNQDVFSGAYEENRKIVSKIPDYKINDIVRIARGKMSEEELKVANLTYGLNGELLCNLDNESVAEMLRETPTQIFLIKIESLRKVKPFLEALVSLS